MTFCNNLKKKIDKSLLSTESDALRYMESSEFPFQIPETYTEVIYSVKKQILKLLCSIGFIFIDLWNLIYSQILNKITIIKRMSWDKITLEATIDWTSCNFRSKQRKLLLNVKLLIFMKNNKELNTKINNK